MSLLLKRDDNKWKVEEVRWSSLEEEKKEERVRHHWTGTKDEKFWKVGREQARVDSGEGQRFGNQNILTRLAAV